MRTINATYVGVLLLAFASGACASIDAGQVQFVHGDSRALGANGVERALKKGDPVYEGETVVTGPSASLQLRMSDEAVIAVRPNSRLQIEVYRFDGKRDGSERGVLRLISGAFRSITGLIGHTKKDNYKVITETANIGIRGTDHEPAYLLPATADAAGTYDKVNTGGTYIATPNGRVDLSPNQVGFASSRPGAVPVQLEHVPGFMRSTPPMGPGASASGESQPSGVAAPGSDGPQTHPVQPWFYSQALAHEQNPRVVTAELNLTYASQMLPIAPSGSSGNILEAGVYGDVTGGVARNGTFTAQQVPAEQFFAGNAKALAATDPMSKLIYTRGAVPAVATGSGSFADNGTTVAVNWGIYGTGAAVNGHMVKDAYTGGAGRQPDYMQVMGALATPDAVVSTLSGTYSTMVTSTPIIAESGAPGGSVTNASIVLASGALTQYQVGVTDGLSRTWSASCSSCASPVPLASFKTSGIALSGSGPTGTATGQANGQPVGPTGQGMISSFALQDTSAAITGSFAVKQ